MEIQKDFNLFSPPLIAGIFGYNINYTLSPLLHNKMAELSDAKLCYGRFDIPPQSFNIAFNGFKALRLKGANITKPYKVEVLKYLEYLNEEAELVGAVNTVNMEDDGSYKGYNTDVPGFIKSVKHEFGIELENKNAILLGAGGASRAILYSLIKENANDILIINRSITNLARLFTMANLWKRILNSRSKIAYSCFGPTDTADVQDDASCAADIMSCIKQCDIIINTITPSKESSDLIGSLPLNILDSKSFVMDISYYPSPTPFLRFFNGNISKSADGLTMLLFQAIESFYIWTGKKIEVSALKGAL